MFAEADKETITSDYGTLPSAGSFHHDIEKHYCVMTQKIVLSLQALPIHITKRVFARQIFIFTGEEL